MTIRQLIGITPNMGMFQFAVIWAAVPAETKARIAGNIVSVFDAFVPLVIAYQTALSVYTPLKKALEDIKQVQTAVSLPLNPGVTAAIVADEAQEVVVSAAETIVEDEYNNTVNALLDTEI